MCQASNFSSFCYGNTHIIGCCCHFEGGPGAVRNQAIVSSAAAFPSTLYSLSASSLNYRHTDGSSLKGRIDLIKKKKKLVCFTIAYMTFNKFQMLARTGEKK